MDIGGVQDSALIPYILGEACTFWMEELLPLDLF